MTVSLLKIYCARKIFNKDVPPEGWIVFMQRYDHAVALVNDVTKNSSGFNIFGCSEVSVLFRECGMPEYDERSH